MAATKTKPAPETKPEATTEEAALETKGRPEHATVPHDLKVGDIVAITQYAKVTANLRGQHVDVRNVDSGMPFSVRGSDLVATLASADQSHEEVPMTKTELAQLLVTLYGRPFTVVFKKADGETRKLRGRLMEPEPLLGRSHVEDLDVEDPKKRLRLVDHRTIESITVGGTMFKLKGK